MTLLHKMESQWHRLPVSLKELCIDTTLRCGQSFRYWLQTLLVCPLHLLT